MMHIDRRERLFCAHPIVALSSMPAADFVRKRIVRCAPRTRPHRWTQASNSGLDRHSRHPIVE